MEEFLIRNTTREQREQIVMDSLGGSEVGCEEYSGAYGYEMYQPYIDGDKELDEITREFRAAYVKDMERQEQSSCGMGRF